MEACRVCESDVDGVCMDRPAKREKRGAVVLEGVVDRSIDVRQHLATCESGILGGMMWGVCCWRAFEDASRIDGRPNSQFEARALIIISAAQRLPLKHPHHPPSGKKKGKKKKKDDDEQQKNCEQ